MSFKVVRDVQGRCIAFGPNDDNYAPGQSYEIEESAPTLWISPTDEINALLAARGLVQKWQVESAAASVLALALAGGLTEAQAYAQRPGYRDAKDLLILIAQKEAQL